LTFKILREDDLDAYWFEDLEQLRIIMDKWSLDYNENHPHKSLGRLSPNQYKLVNDDHIKHEKLNLALS